MPDFVNFGHRTVRADEKQPLVDEVFHGVAARYDLMNDAMSFGLHRRWKDMACRGLARTTPAHLLDVGAGTGDLAMRLLRANPLRAHSDAPISVELCDPNPAMTAIARQQLENAGFLGRFAITTAYAEKMPYPDTQFDGAIAGFSMRNTTDLAGALHEIARVLRPNARFRVLEFTQVPNPLWAKAYAAWRDHALPRIGQLIADNADAYRYLAESIERFPRAEALSEMMEANGFGNVQHRLLAGGIVALHQGIRHA